MGIRTNPDAVKAILGYNYDFKRNFDLSGFIESASSIVDQVVANALLLSPAVTVPDTTAELTERWLSAYFYCKMDPITSSRSNGASASFVTSTSLENEGERYKRGAIEIDTSGCLHALLNRNVATAVRIGDRCCPPRF